MSDSRTSPRTKSCSKRWRRGHTLNRLLFSFVISGGKSGLSLGGVGKESSFHGGAECRWKMWFWVIARVGYSLSKYRKQKHRPTPESHNFLKGSRGIYNDLSIHCGLRKKTCWLILGSKKLQHMCHSRKEMSKASIKCLTRWLSS